MPVHVSSTVVLIIRRSKLYYTASGIVHCVGGRPVHRLRTGRPPTQCDDNRRCIIKFLPPDNEHNSARNM